MFVQLCPQKILKWQSMPSTFSKSSKFLSLVPHNLLVMPSFFVPQSLFHSFDFSSDHPLSYLLLPLLASQVNQFFINFFFFLFKFWIVMNYRYASFFSQELDWETFHKLNETNKSITIIHNNSKFKEKKKEINEELVNLWC